MGQAAIIRFRIPVVSNWPKGITETSNTPAAPPDEPDEILLQMIARGNTEAVSALFRSYARQVWSIGQRILQDKTEAEDLVQEVFLYIHRKSGLFDRTRGSARSWIIQVAYTQAFLRRRELKSHGFYRSEIACKSVEYDQRSDNAAPYDQTVEGLFGRNGWKEVMNSLTEDQRETLRLHFFEGHTFAEIGEKLGQSYANVRNHHYRGLEKLRKVLADSELNRR
jgi:RNA polymerase sigma-70 factor, ECF subfamily